MDPDDLIEIDLDSVEAAYLESAYAEFWLELRAPSELLRDAAAKRAFDDALAETNDRFSIEWGPFTHAPATSARGFTMLCSGVQDVDQLGRWLVVVAERLEEHGLHGVIRGTGSGDRPS